MCSTIKLGSLRSALQFVHHPPQDADTAALLLGRHPAQARLAFEELLAHNLSLKRMRQALRTCARRWACPGLGATAPSRARS